MCKLLLGPTTSLTELPIFLLGKWEPISQRGAVKINSEAECGIWAPPLCSFGDDTLALNLLE